MDPVTHGIIGALLGKGYFSERNGRVAIFAATRAPCFPDIDIVADAIFSSDPLAIIKYHRGITHSFVGLPFFAALLAWLTRSVLRSLKNVGVCATGIRLRGAFSLSFTASASPATYLLDGMTSFGTRMLIRYRSSASPGTCCSSSILSFTVDCAAAADRRLDL